jgi:CheY-like chemotaxis protein
VRIRTPAHASRDWSHGICVQIVEKSDAICRGWTASVMLQETRDSMKTILVVDDDNGVRELLRRVLEHLGHQVEDASNALEALEVLKTRPVDLALCDVRMPGHDGVWLTDQILARYPGTAVALATGLIEMDPAVTLRPGVVGYIVKPFKRAAVVELLRVAFENPARPQPAVIDFAALDAL